MLASGIVLLSLSGVAAVALAANVEELANAGPQQAAVQGSQQPIGTPILSGSQDPPDNTPAPPPTHHIGGDVSAPKLIYAPAPEYPQGETKEGVVVLNCIIDAKGLTRQVHVVRSFAPNFDKNAVGAVEQYRFTPAMLKGKPVPVTVNIEVNFRHR